MTHTSISTDAIALNSRSSPSVAVQATPSKARHSESELATARRKYQYNYSHIPPIAMVNRLPREEMPSMAWWSKVLKVMVEILINATVARHGHSEQEAHHHVSGLLRHSLLTIFRRSGTKVRLKVLWHLLKIAPKLLLKGLKLSLKDFEDFSKSLVLEFEHDILRLLHLGVKEQVNNNKPHTSEDCANCLSGYNKQFATIDLPAIAHYFNEDEFFAYLRIAGPNPVMLERVTHQDGDILGPLFPVTNDHYQSVMGEQDTLENAIQEGRVYLANYAILAGAVNGTYPEYQKYIDAPLALFAIPSEGSFSRHLRPVAIQCQQAPGPDNPIFTPKPQGSKEEIYAWEMAKRTVQVADSNYHEAVTHLGRTHLFMSPFVMATHRQLPKEHPVSILLRPHFEGTLSINNGAQSMLISPLGGVDTVLATTIDCARALTATGVQTYGFNSAMLPNQLESRGLNDASTLPNYPYRDDALLLWEAIEEWVSDYIALYYTNDEAVEKDSALQAWATELQAFEGGRVQDFGEDGELKTCSYLIQALTLLIFTASAQHAAVNFPQGDVMVYTPAMPLAGYAPAPTETTASHDQELAQLPPMHQALEQMELTYLLGQIYHTQLGQYCASHFKDDQVTPYLKAFQEKLQTIEATIDERNQKRPYPYEYLKPSRIPQSINI